MKVIRRKSERGMPGWQYDIQSEEVPTRPGWEDTGIAGDRRWCLLWIADQQD